MLETLGHERVDVAVALVAEVGQDAEADERSRSQQPGQTARSPADREIEPDDGQEYRQQSAQVEPEVGELADPGHRVIAGEVGHGHGALVEGHPEKDDDEEDQAEGRQPFPGLLGRKLDDLVPVGLRLGFLALGHVGGPVMPAQGPEDDHRGHQADAGDAEAEMVGLAQGVDVVLGEGAQGVERDGRVLGPGNGQVGFDVGQLALEELVGHGRDAGVVKVAGLAQYPVGNGLRGRGREHGPDVDAHVEDVEGPVPQGGILGVVVKVPDQGLQVALEEPCAQGDDGQGGDDQPEAGLHPRGQGQHGVADEHHDHADGDGPAVAEVAVGQETAEKREDVDADHEGRIHEAGRRRRHAVFGLHEQDEQAYHGVEAEAFAHVGEEGYEQSLGMLFEHGLPSDQAHSAADYTKKTELFPFLLTGGPAGE